MTNNVSATVAKVAAETLYIEDLQRISASVDPERFGKVFTRREQTIAIAQGRIDELLGCYDFDAYFEISLRVELAVEELRTEKSAIAAMREKRRQAFLARRNN